MVRLITQPEIMKLLVAILVAWQLTACGGGGESNSASFYLNWVAPVTRADGNPISLADIDGYHVYYGTSTGNYTDSIDVTDGSETSVTVTGILADTYYVVMTTYDLNGSESVYSPEIEITAQ